MMAWFIWVPDGMYFEFYRLLWKFEIPFAEFIEESLPGVSCLIFGPAELWKKALSYDPSTFLPPL